MERYTEGLGTKILEKFKWDVMVMTCHLLIVSDVRFRSDVLLYGHTVNIVTAACRVVKTMSPQVPR